MENPVIVFAVWAEMRASTLVVSCITVRPVAAGISRDSLHKRRETGGKQNSWRKKRKYVLQYHFS